MKRLGIVIPVYNQIFYTKRLLQSIREHKCTACDQVIICVINNASTDGTKEYLNYWWADITEKEAQHNNIVGKATRIILESRINLGFGPAVNKGIFHILKDYPDADILVMNNDMELLPGCIDALLQERPDDVGIVGGRLLFADGRIQHAGAFLNIYGWGQHKGAGEVDNDPSVQQTEEECEYVTGALFLIKNKLLQKLDHFDERFAPAYFEEVDMCYEAHKLGFKSLYCPTAKSYHYENKTGIDIYRDIKKVNDISRNNQIKFYMKHDEDSYEFESEDRVMFCCKIMGEWSFSIVMRNLAKGLGRNGVDVAIAPEEYHQPGNVTDWEIKRMINKPHDYWNRHILRSSEGDHLYLMPPGKSRIAHTTGESNRINRAWRDQLNAVDKIITNSTFFREIMLNHGVTVPIFIVPNATDLNIYKPSTDIMPLNYKRGMNFISVFHFGERKNPEALFRSFIEEFDAKDDVTLTVHSLSLHYVLQQQGKNIKQYIQELSGGKSHAPIYCTNTLLSDSVMPFFLRNFDCNLLTTRGEGFGNSIIECAALGIPSIVTGYSGVTDFVNSEVGWTAEYKLVDIPLQVLPYFKNYIGGQWAEVSIEHFRSLLRYAYNHRDEVKDKGKASLIKTQNYSVEAVGKLAKQVIFGD
ncbi:MAG: glycosyltransferase [Candidatus Pacearchaeota archaeon]|jgi:hypothetical protein